MIGSTDIFAFYRFWYLKADGINSILETLHSYYTRHVWNKKSTCVVKSALTLYLGMSVCPYICLGVTKSGYFSSIFWLNYPLSLVSILVLIIAFEQRSSSRHLFSWLTMACIVAAILWRELFISLRITYHHHFMISVLIRPFIALRGHCNSPPQFLGAKLFYNSL